MSVTSINGSTRYWKHNQLRNAIEAVSKARAELASARSAVARAALDVAKQEDELRQTVLWMRGDLDAIEAEMLPTQTAEQAVVASERHIRVRDDGSLGNEAQKAEG